MDGLRRRMEAHLEVPPDGLWDEIEREMDRRAQAAARRRLALSWSIGSAAAAVVVFFLLIGVDGLDDGVLPPAVDGSLSQTVPVQYPKPDPVVEHAPVPSPIPEPTTARNRDRVTISTPAPSDFVGDVGGNTPDETSDAPSGDPAPKRPAVRDEWPAGSATYPDPVVSKPKKSRWKASLYASNITSGNSTGNNPQPVKAAASVALNDNVNYFGVNSESAFARASVRTDSKHRLPLSAGISVSYDLDERWSIASGLNYIMLSSRFQEVRAGDTHSSKQILHNIGIPLSVNYNVWRGGRLSFYLSGGGQIEKSVAGNITADPLLNFTSIQRQSASVSDRVQFSVTGSVGAQYDLSKITGLYIEPGINYWFDNGSAIETVYKAKPLNFGLRLGVRFSL